MLLLIPLLPLLGFVVNAFVGRRLSKSVSGGVACLAMIASFAVSVMAVSAVMSSPSHAIEQTVYHWIPSGELQIPFELRLDHLASLMILVVTGIGSLIHIYSTGYMHEESDSEYARYFSYLNLFASFMLVLVLGASLRRIGCPTLVLAGANDSWLGVAPQRQLAHALQRVLHGVDDLVDARARRELPARAREGLQLDL